MTKVEELREAVIFLKDYTKNFKERGYSDGVYIEFINKVVDFAESVLSADGWPIKKYHSIEHDGFSHPHETPEDAEWNAAIDLCQIAHAKAMLKKDEEVQEYIEECIKAGLKEKDKEIAELKAQLNRAELQQPACNHDWQPEWHTDQFITSSAVKKWRCTKCLATTLTVD
jgi:hypothetical protein